MTKQAAKLLKSSFLLASLSLAPIASAADVVDVLPLTDRVLMIHFDEGYVEHHKVNRPRSDEKVVISPLDIDKATRASSFTISGPDNISVDRINRKSKGTRFAWFTDRWVNGRAVNDRPDHTKEHWIYLTLSSPLQPGQAYTISTGELAKNGSEFKFTFDDHIRSEAVHVNLLGYVPDAPEKFGYVYHWMGDAGELDLKAKADAAFHLIDAKTNARVFTGKLVFRKAADNQETLHVTDSPPHGSYLKASVYEADFSAFNTPGEYRLFVEGVGSSFPFKVDPDVIRPAYRATVRALYHNRSGIALTKPYTEFERPAPGHPKLTPGFEGKLIYSTLRSQDFGSESGTKEAILATKKGTLEDAWGWYQDAGDWDSYESHLNVPQCLLFAYMVAPKNFADNENNIPESGNGVPDILDEASWLPRFCFRLRQELIRKGWGTGGIGMRVAGDAFGTDEGTNPDGSKFGRGSWQDNDRFYAVSGEDPWSTYRYAGVAAQLAMCLDLAKVKDPDGVDWIKEARESYAWAKANTGPKDDNNELRTKRAYAAIALYSLTNEEAYLQQFEADTKNVGADASVHWEEIYPFYLAAMKNHDRSIQIVFHNANLAVDVANRRALRWAGKWDMPMLVGQQTTPWAFELAVGRVLATRARDNDRATKYQAAMYTTADYFLGTNSQNMTWITGVGPRFPTEIFHMDAWYLAINQGTAKTRYPEGFIPYSPWRKQAEFGNGPWDQHWAHRTTYPVIDQWPGNEQWFSNRCSPMGSEFTIHQNIAPAAAFFGVLAGEK